MTKSRLSIILIGMAGAGKSTIGYLLAKNLNWAFVDSDSIIESLYGCDLQDIADELDKEAFLDLENHVILSLRLSRTILATGGSVIYREAEMQHLQEMGLLVYLDAPLKTIEQRIAANPRRGLAKGPNQSLEDIFKEREALYRHYANLTCPTYPYTPDECVAWILKNLPPEILQSS